MEHDVLTVEEAAAFLRVQRNTVYEAVGRQDIPHRRLGRRILILKSALVEWLAGGLRAASPAAVYAAPQVETSRAAPPPSAATIVDTWRWRPRSRRSPQQVADVKELVMKAVEGAPGKGARDYAEATGMTSYEIGFILPRLVVDGRLVKSGKGPQTKYRPRMS